MGISRPPDSFGIKSHFSDRVNFRLNEEREKVRKRSTRINRGERLQRESDEDTLTSVYCCAVLDFVVLFSLFIFHIILLYSIMYTMVANLCEEKNKNKLHKHMLATQYRSQDIKKNDKNRFI